MGRISDQPSGDFTQRNYEYPNCHRRPIDRATFGRQRLLQIFGKRPRIHQNNLPLHPLRRNAIPVFIERGDRISSKGPARRTLVVIFIWFFILVLSLSGKNE